MATASHNNRKLRLFKRWMNSQGIDCSDALLLSISTIEKTQSISVKALCDLHENDVIATIPKESCLTVKTSSASCLIEEAELGGYLGLAVAVMYERSLGPQSKWFEYLQLMPYSEPIPMLWSISEIDSLLQGTEIHKIVKEDKALVYQDWKECIKPLLSLDSFKLNPDFFTIDEYLAAKSLIASRSFEIDEHHGSGMVPLADLFNHKTAAEDVHFTHLSSSSESDSDDEIEEIDEPEVLDFASEMEDFEGSDLKSFSNSESDLTVMQMIIVKDVKAGAEVFNTYGSLGNAALLHRYGFTEPNNPFDILNIDLETVLQWSSSSFSSRHSRTRLSLFKKLGYSPCASQKSQYFEISFDGEPQIELLILLHIILLPEDSYRKLDLTLSDAFSLELSEELLLTRSVCEALLLLADSRESFYGPNSLEDDVKLFNECCVSTEHKLYHSLVLRISERRILEKLRSYAASWKGKKNRNRKGGKRM